MAGDEEGDGVAAHRVARRARGPCAADLLGEASVGRDRAGGNAQEGAPHGELEVGSAHMHRQRAGVRIERRREDGLRDRAGPRVIGFQHGSSPGTTEPPLLGLHIPGACERESADAPVRPRYEDGPERGISRPEADPEPRAPAPVLARRRGFHRHEVIVQPSRAGQPASVRRRENRFGVVEQLPGVPDGQELQEAFGRDSGPPGEQPMQMARAEPDLRRHLREVRLARAMAVEVADGGLDAVVVGHVHLKLRKGSLGRAFALS